MSNKNKKVGRKSRNSYLLEQIGIINKEIADSGKDILSIVDIGNISNSLINLNEEFIMPYSLSRKQLAEFLCETNILTMHEIKKKDRVSRKYVFGDLNIYELALSLGNKSYLTHYTAVFLHSLTDNIPKVIYINSELSFKSPKSNQDIEQSNIDRAFSRPMRKTNNVSKFNDFELIVLNGKNTNNLEVIEMNVSGKILPITSIERTLIDIVVRPLYSGGINEVLNVYKNAEGKFSTGRLLSTLTKLDYAYPYHQSIGFYMEKAGYSESVLKRIEKIEKPNDFYLGYQMKDVSYSKRWKLYYPTYLD